MWNALKGHRAIVKDRAELRRLLPCLYTDLYLMHVSDWGVCVCACVWNDVCAFNCLCLHLRRCCVSVCAAVISFSRVIAGVCVCEEVKIGRDALDCSHISAWTSLHVLHLPFSPPNHSVSITRLPDQYLLCMAFSVLRQHLKPSEMIPPGTHPPGKGLFVQTAGDIGRVNLY